jgi:hypothetical protein
MTALAGKNVSGAAHRILGSPVSVSAAPLWFILYPCRHSHASGKLPATIDASRFLKADIKLTDF